MNYRDLMVANGAYPVKIDIPIIPCSGGAGDVVAVGSMVTRVQPGDRIAAFVNAVVSKSAKKPAVTRASGISCWQLCPTALVHQLFVQRPVIQHPALVVHDPHRIRRDLVDDHDLAVDEADFDLHVDQTEPLVGQV